MVRANRVENRDAVLAKSAVGYNIDATPDATTEVRNNVGLNCARYNVGAKIVSADNDWR
jgi:hypothetical protein